MSPRLTATVLAAVLGLTGLGWSAQTSTDASAGLLVRAEFADASPLLAGNEVKADGVPVGTVEALDAVGNKAVVTLLLDPAALPVHRDARFTIRPVSLLGERFVELDRGSAEAGPLPAGATVPIARTGTNTDLDQVLNSLDDPTGAGLAALVGTLGGGLHGNGANTAQTLRALRPALDDSRGFARVLREQNDVLNRMVDNLRPVLGALAADRGGRLDRLVGSADGLLKVTAERQSDLEATLTELPSSLASASTALDRVGGTARATTPDLRSLRPLTEPLVEVSGELRDFADALDPALSGTGPMLERFDELLAKARPALDELRRAGPDLRGSTAGARPLTAELSRNLDDVYDFLRFWAQTANGHDGLSNYFRGFVVANPQSATGVLPPAVADAVPWPGPAGAWSGATERKPGLPELKPGLLESPSARKDRGLTGLNPDQERGITGLLLGGAK
jgi:phospholipid/cholesterol/gamma-HCH transport system substrate-binding protein